MLAIGVVMRALVRCIARMTGSESALAQSSSGPFDLQHLLLNVDALMLPAWCNLGWWTPQMQQQTQAASQPLSYPQACTELVRQLAAAAGVDDRSEILDVGCGCGEQDLYLAHTLRPRRIVAVNVAPVQIAWAKQRMAALDAQAQAKNSDDAHQQQAATTSAVQLLSERISFHVGSATELDRLRESESGRSISSSAAPLPASFSHVLAIDCAYHFDTRARFFAQSYNALQTGGTLALVDMLPNLPPAAASILGGANAQHVALSWRARWGLRLVSSACGVPLANLYSQEEYRRLLTAAGFEDIELRDISEHMFAGFAQFVRQRSDTSAVLGSGWFRPSLWLRYRITAAALDYIAAHQLATFLLVTAKKSRRPLAT